jgi:BirA family biotin operon repressor/biotin-[acetyl-CoA-carboxylase] ligase
MSFASLSHLLRLLSATESRSSAFLAGELGCQQEWVIQQISDLSGLGLLIDTHADGGFLLKEPLELLERNLIFSAMDPGKNHLLTDLSIEISLDSTNSALQRLDVGKQHATAILAEHQSSGRGQRGRQWVSPFARNLYLSLGWRFEKPLSELACLPLVLALATAKALSRAGLRGHLIKWPNDLLLDGQKLSGCLVEMQGGQQGPCHAVLGVGINVDMPVSDLTAGIKQAWTDLSAQLPSFSRNQLAALLLEELLEHLLTFSGQGFAPFWQSWQQMDGLYGQVISVQSGKNLIEGTAKGIDEQGALILDTGKEILTLHSGEVSLHKTSL